MTKFLHGAIIPLNGGCLEGVSQALDTAPSLILSKPCFKKNDSYAHKWFGELCRNKPEPGHVLIKDDMSAAIAYQKMCLDVISSVPPCSGLSMFNASKDSSKCGVDAEQNKHMFDATVCALRDLKPRVFFFENAPALFAAKGEPLVERLKELAAEHGYGLTLVKTNTFLHKVPQKRPRTFAVFYQGGVTPFVDGSPDPRRTPSLAEYLSGVKDNPMRSWSGNLLHEDAWWLACLNVFGGEAELRKAHRNAKAGTLFNLVCRLGLQEQAKAALRKVGTRDALAQERLVDRMLSRIGSGQGVWDGAPYITSPDFFNAVTGRNAPRAIHWEEPRFISLREHMTLMGLPAAYPEFDKGDENIVAQSVPVNTAKELVELAILPFLEGKARMSGKAFQRVDWTAAKREQETGGSVDEVF